MDNRLQLVFYGDDFTGSTDALELLHLAGIKAALFPSVPSRGQIEAFPDLEAFGVAGTTRSMNPDAMRETLEPVFSFIRSLKPRHFHYKVCSTFDSSPAIGNIGVAMRVGAATFKARFVPILVGVPDLGRYCVFGHLYARLGTGRKGFVYRIDRHPSMAHHPVTPARESDIRLRLREQAGWETALFDVFHCRMGREQAAAALEKILDEKYVEGVLFDALVDDDLLIPGMLMEASAPDNGTLFSVGSSAVEHALIRAWPGGLSGVEPAASQPPSGDPLLVLSGSCSPVTIDQMRAATDAGFTGFALDMAALIEGNEEAVIEGSVERVTRILQDRKSAIVHTYSGEDDQRIKATRRAIRRNLPEGAVATEVPRILGTAMGRIARQVMERTDTARIVVAGGDTSGHVSAAMGIEALSVSQAFVRGAPFCHIHAPGSSLHHREINFKGGQIGTTDYFLKAAAHPKPVN